MGISTALKQHTALRFHLKQSWTWWVPADWQIAKCSMVKEAADNNESQKNSHTTGDDRLRSSTLLLHAANWIRASSTNTRTREIKRNYKYNWSIINNCPPKGQRWDILWSNDRCYFLDITKTPTPKTICSCHLQFCINFNMWCSSSWLQLIDELHYVTLIKWDYWHSCAAI